jgi:O-antigen biosynthesis protein
MRVLRLLLLLARVFVGASRRRGSRLAGGTERRGEKTGYRKQGTIGYVASWASMPTVEHIRHTRPSCHAKGDVKSRETNRKSTTYHDPEVSMCGRLLDAGVPYWPMHPVVLDGKFFSAGNRRFLIKGVTYGTFAPRRDGSQYPPDAVVARDLSAIAAAGFNTVRVYTPPPESLLDRAQAEGLRVMVGLPWTQHVAFLDDRAMSDSIRRDIPRQVRELARHPAVLMFALGNEISPGVVRWHGRRRIERFLRELCEEARAQSPTSLFTYVNYPPTSYLDLSPFDLYAFNVYLHRERDLREYLGQLQNLAGSKPLLLAEAGADSRREGDEGQSDITAMHVRAAFEEGACGAVAFAWTDEWWRGGSEVTDWAFGLVDRERRPKPALDRVARVFHEAPFSPARSAAWPHVSVIICAYNAADTIGECLASLDRLEYPDFDVIVVNDGSRDATGAIAHAWADGQTGRRIIDVENGGLSRARNIGLEHATGAIVAYTDADVRVDPYWLTYLVQPLITSDVVGCGGPNVSPPDDPAVAQCVARAPGGPAHVLLDDRIAEHVPGCNMAFRREALGAVGGFNPIYLRAGDDVDVCWRLQARGWKIGFAPAALVWHRHRASVRAYWRQQVGYGEGEAWLALKHPDKFVGGDMLWRGRIYSALPFVRGLYRERLNTGSWGTAAFPSVYNIGASGVSYLPASAGWMVLSLVLLAAGALLDRWFADIATAALTLGAAGVAASMARAAQFAITAEFPAATFPQRLLVGWLHLVQPLARLRGRVRGRFAAPSDLTASAAATTVKALPAIGRALALTAGVRLERRFWTESWTSLPSLLEQLVTALRHQRGAGRVDVDEGWAERWDVALPIGGFARLEARGLVEEHARGACLVRTSTRVRPTAVGCAGLAGLAAAVAGAMLLERAGNNAGSLALVVICALTLFWALRRIVFASARMGAAVGHVASANALLPLSERPAWRPAVAGLAAGTLQATMVIALGAFFLMTAAPTVWDAADDYFPARPRPAATVVQPVSIVAEPPPVRVAKAPEHRATKTVPALHPPLPRRGGPLPSDRRRT